VLVNSHLSEQQSFRELEGMLAAQLRAMLGEQTFEGPAMMMRGPTGENASTRLLKRFA
jgi:hypothetical protein